MHYQCTIRMRSPYKTSSRYLFYSSPWQVTCEEAIEIILCLFYIFEVNTCSLFCLGGWDNLTSWKICESWQYNYTQDNKAILASGCLWGMQICLQQHVEIKMVSDLNASNANSSFECIFSITTLLVRLSIIIKLWYSQDLVAIFVWIICARHSKKFWHVSI